MSFITVIDIYYFISAACRDYTWKQLAGDVLGHRRGRGAGAGQTGLVDLPHLRCSMSFFHRKGIILLRNSTHHHCLLWILSLLSFPIPIQCLRWCFFSDQCLRLFVLIFRCKQSFVVVVVDESCWKLLENVFAWNQTRDSSLLSFKMFWATIGILRSFYSFTTWRLF